MTVNVERLVNMADRDISRMSNAEMTELAGSLLELQQDDRRQNQLLYYKPASARAAEVHKSRARVVGVGGGNGACLPLDAPVLMADATWRALGDVGLGDMVMAADPDTGNAVPARVTNTFRSGKKPVYRVEFSDGGWFEATAEHQVPMYLGSGRTTTKGNPKKPFKRRLGDYVEPIMRRGTANPSKRISCVSPGDISFERITCALPLPPYTLGALLGDGSMGRPTRLHNESPAIVERVRSELAPMGISLVHYGDKGDWGLVNAGQEGKWQQHCPPSRVRIALNSMGLLRANSYTKFIPRGAFAMPREWRMELLAGLIDTDGGENTFSSCSRQLAEDFCLLVRTLGGKATINRHMARCQNGAEVETNLVYWRLNEPPPLCLKFKYVPSQRGRAIDYRRRICRSSNLARIAECGDIEVDHPAHCYITRDYTIVSNSKTDTCLAEICALATGVFPPDFYDDFKAKFRGPVRCRIVIESLTTTLDSTILPKFQWWKWSGVGEAGSDKGHWGWVPKACLKDGSWDKSWKEKTRTLTVICRDPDDGDRILGESMFQFMSHDQDPSDFASGDFNHVLHDEPPRLAIWRENEARTMRATGRMYLSMTWPDDPAIPVDWIHDEVYDKGVAGPNKVKDVDWFELYTTDNRFLNQDSVKTQMGAWSEETKRVRIYGQPIRFSNRIHPLFTDAPLTWSYAAGRIVVAEGDVCPETGSTDIVRFCHVEDIQPSQRWPTVFLLDPHPRKPHMFIWAQIDPNDDIQIIDFGEMDGDTNEVRDAAFRVEETYGLHIADRLIDPNMGRSPASTKRNVTWQDEFSSAGLHCALADDSDVGRARINEYLKPDPRTLRPRIVFASRCIKPIFQMKRYVWDNYRRADERDLKQSPKTKNDDYPTLLKYLLNSEPRFDMLYRGAPVLRYGRSVEARTRVNVR